MTKLMFIFSKIAKITAINAKVFWLRIVLTIFGIFIGVASVIATFSLNRNMEASLERQINESGGPTVTVESSVAPFLNKVTREEFSKIFPGLENLFFISIVENAAALVKNELEAIAIVGTDLDFLSFKKYPVFSGRVFDIRDENQRVIVLGFEFAKRLFGEENPLGQYMVVKLGGTDVSMRVIGILDQVASTKMSIDLADPNVSSFMPLSTMKSIIQPVPLLSLVIKPDTVDRIPAYHTIIKNLYKTTGSQYSSISDVMRAAEKIRADVSGIFIAGLIVGILSLINGGVGIMNIMLVSIMQRKKEIGLYKTFGFSKGLITMQFTSEALLISLLGAIAGVIAGIPLSNMISRLILSENLGADPLAVFVGFTFTVFIGLIFGIMPARRAAKLDPVSAIKGT